MERLVFQVLFVILFTLIVGYLYFVTASVLNIIARKEANIVSGRLEGAIASMEQEYFALSESIDAESASSLGLAPLHNTAYVYRPGSTAAAGTIEPNAI